MGGLVATHYLAEDRPHPSGAVLSAPALDAEVPLPLRLAVRMLGRIAPRFALENSIKGEQLSRDPEVGKAYFADPLVNTKATLGLGAAFFDAQDRSKEVIGTIDTPAFVIHGGDDPLVPPAMSAPLATSPSVERKVYPGIRHEIHNEPEQAQVLGEVAAWLDSRLA